MTPSSSNSSGHKVGNYAVNSTKSRPWLETPINQSQSKTRRSKSLPLIINPIFDECAQLTTDPYWMSIFNQAAIGKFPRGFMYRDGYLTYKKGNRVQRLEMPQAPIEAYSACLSFFNKTAGMMSTSDMAKNQQEYDLRISTTKSIFDCTWSDIKNSEIRKLLFSDFNEELSKRFRLTTEEKLQLSTTIHLGFYLGYFQDRQVDFREGKIHSIKGLLFNHESRLFTIDPKLQPKVVKISKRIQDGSSRDKNSLLSQWNKYLEKYEKKYAMNTGSTMNIINSPKLIISDLESIPTTTETS